jgi:hypothetical protein
MGKMSGTYGEKMRSAYKFVTRISERDKTPGKPMNKQENNIKMDITGILFGLDFSSYPLSSVLCLCELVHAPFSFIKGVEFFEQLSAYQRLKKETALWPWRDSPS